MPKPIGSIEVPRMHSPQSVADHEVLLSFAGDADALDFDTWWREWGETLFREWAKVGREERE